MKYILYVHSCIFLFFSPATMSAAVITAPAISRQGSTEFVVKLPPAGNNSSDLTVMFDDIPPGKLVCSLQAKDKNWQATRVIATYCNTNGYFEQEQLSVSLARDFDIIVESPSSQFFPADGTRRSFFTFINEMDFQRLFEFKCSYVTSEPTQVSSRDDKMAQTLLSHFTTPDAYYEAILNDIAAKKPSLPHNNLPNLPAYMKFQHEALERIDRATQLLQESGKAVDVQSVYEMLQKVDQFFYGHGQSFGLNFPKPHPNDFGIADRVVKYFFSIMPSALQFLRDFDDEFRAFVNEKSLSAEENMQLGDFQAALLYAHKLVNKAELFYTQLRGESLPQVLEKRLTSRLHAIHRFLQRKAVKTKESSEEHTHKTLWSFEERLFAFQLEFENHRIMSILAQVDVTHLRPKAKELLDFSIGLHPLLSTVFGYSGATSTKQQGEVLEEEARLYRHYVLPNSIVVVREQGFTPQHNFIALLQTQALNNDECGRRRINVEHSDAMLARETYLDAINETQNVVFNEELAHAEAELPNDAHTDELTLENNELSTERSVLNDCQDKKHGEKKPLTAKKQRWSGQPGSQSRDYQPSLGLHLASSKISYPQPTITSTKLSSKQKETLRKLLDESCGVAWDEFLSLCAKLNITLKGPKGGSSHKNMFYGSHRLGTVWQPHLERGAKFGKGQTHLIRGYLNHAKTLGLQI